MECDVEILLPRLGNGRYEFVRKVGDGGQATVGLYYDVNERRNVVIKAYSLQSLGQNDIDRLKREEIVLRELMHPYIVHCYGSIQTLDGLFVIEEYVTGRTLQEFGKAIQKGDLEDFSEERNGKWYLAPPYARLIAEEIFETLAALHCLSIVHRDIKPENIIFNDQTRRITLIDFDAAKLETVMGSVITYVGTHQFMSPEFFTGKPYTEKTDIWSAGATMFWLISNSLPFGTVFNFKRVIEGAYDRLPEFVPNDVKSMVYDCLKCDESERLDGVELLEAYFPGSRELRIQFLSKSVEETSIWSVYVMLGENQPKDSFLCAEEMSEIILNNAGVSAVCNFVLFRGKEFPRGCKYCLNLSYSVTSVQPPQILFTIAIPGVVLEKQDNIITIQEELDIVDYLLKNRAGEQEKGKMEYGDYQLPSGTCGCC